MPHISKDFERIFLTYTLKKIDKLSFLAKGRWCLRGAKADASIFKDIHALAEHHFSHNSEPDHPCRQTLTEALIALDARPATIIETGSSAWGSNSSRFFDYYVASFGGTFSSVDIRIQPSLTLRPLCSKYSSFHCDDSIQFLQKWSKLNPGKKIDLLYLDSWDLDVKKPNPSALHGLGEFLAASAHLTDGSILLVDDTPLDPFEMSRVQPKVAVAFQKYFEENGFYPGKGTLIKHLLQSIGRGKQVAHHYQLLWRF